MTTKIHLLSIFAIATILLTSTLVPNFVAYADDDDDDDDRQTITELQKKCQKDPRNPIKIKAECELLNIIDDLKEDQTTKNEQIDALIDALEEKDVELMDKDSELMTKDGDLMSDLSDLSSEVLKVCNNVPLFNLVLGATVTFLDGTSEALSGLKQGLDLVKGVAPSFTVPIPSFSTGNIIPTVSPQFRTVDPCDTFDTSLKNFDCPFTFVKGFDFGTTSITLDIPDPTVDLGAIFKGISSVILPATDGLDEAATALTLVQECNTDNLPI